MVHSDWWLDSSVVVRLCVWERAILFFSLPFLFDLNQLRAFTNSLKPVILYHVLCEPIILFLSNVNYSCLYCCQLPFHCQTLLLFHHIQNLWDYWAHQRSRPICLTTDLHYQSMILLQKTPHISSTFFLCTVSDNLIAFSIKSLLLLSNTFPPRF